MNVALVVSVLLVSVLSASAQELSPTYLNCMRKSSTQIPNTRCAAEEMKRVEGELDAKYSRAVAAAAETPEAASKIKAARAAWEAFVGAYINAVFPLENKQAENGTSYGAKVGIWRVKLAQTQLVVLDNLIAQYSQQQ